MERSSRVFHLRDADDYSQRQLKTEFKLERELGIDLINADPSTLSLKDKLRRKRQIEAQAKLATPLSINGAHSIDQHETLQEVTLNTSTICNSGRSEEVLRQSKHFQDRLYNLLGEHLPVLITPTELEFYKMLEEDQLTTQQIAEIKGYSSYRVVAERIRVIRTKLSPIIEEAGLKRSTSFEYPHVPKLVSSKSIPGITFLNAVYTTDAAVNHYLQNYARTPNPELKELGYTDFYNLLKEDPDTYWKIHYRYYNKGEKKLLVETNNVLYVSEDVIKSVRLNPKSKQFNHKTLQPPKKGFVPVATFSPVKSERIRVRYAAQKGYIQGIQKSSGLWFVDPHEAQEYLEKKREKSEEVIFPSEDKATVT